MYFEELLSVPGAEFGPKAFYSMVKYSDNRVEAAYFVFFITPTATR